MVTNNQSMTEPSTPLRNVTREDTRIGYYSNPLKFGIHLPPYELPAITARLGLRSIPGSRGSRPTTPKFIEHGNQATSDISVGRRSRIQTPTRGSTNYVDEVRNKRRRRSSIIITQKGDAVFDPNYVGPITIDYLKFFCKVVVKERERVDVAEDVEGKVLNTSESQQLNEPPSVLNPLDQVFDQSLPIPNSDGLLQSPMRLLSIKTNAEDPAYRNRDSSPQSIIDTGENIQDRTPPYNSHPNQPEQPKTYSYLEKILLARKLKTKSLTNVTITREGSVHTPIRKALDAQDPILNEDSSDRGMAEDRRVTFNPPPIKKTLSPPTSDKHTESNNFTHINISSSRDTQDDVESHINNSSRETQNYPNYDNEPHNVYEDEPVHDQDISKPSSNVVGLDNTPPYDTVIGRPELSGSSMSNVVTPQTMFSDSLYPENYSPPILMQEEYTTNNRTNEVLDHFLAIDGDSNEVAPIEMGQETDLLANELEEDNVILPNELEDDNVILPNELAYQNEALHDFEPAHEVLPTSEILTEISSKIPLMRIPKHSNTAPRRSNSVIPLRTVKTLVKSVILHSEGSNKEPKKKRKVKPISKDMYTLLQEKSEEFLGTLVSDLGAYASHRSNNHGSQINMKDLLLYLRRVKHRDDENTTSELERISRLAQNILPLELLLELDNTLRGSNDAQLTMERETASDEESVESDTQHSLSTDISGM